MNILNMNTETMTGQLERDTRSLCTPDGRMVGSAGHRRAEEFVARRLEEAGCEPYRSDRGGGFSLSYERHNLSFTNLVGVVPGRNRKLPPVLIGAHYDSVIAAPCADDNAVAVAMCFALAEMAQAAGGLERDLLVAIFDAEEPPYFQTSAMGSTRFHDDELDKRGVHAAVIFDLVGHDVSLLGVASGKVAELLFMTGAESHPQMSSIVESAELPANLRLIATLNKYVGDMSDHGVFRRNNVPYLFFSCGRWIHYHQPTDTPDVLNYLKSARITRFVSNLLPPLADADLSNPDPGSGNSPVKADTMEFEIRTIETALGEFYRPALAWAGIKGPLRTREDIDQFVSALMSTGL